MSLLAFNDNNLELLGLYNPVTESYINDALVTCVVGSRTSSEFGTVTAATNATPIVVTTAAHGRTTGEEVVITQMEGLTAANAKHTLTKVDNDSFSLDDSVGNADWVQGGLWYLVHTTVTLSYVSGSNGNYRGIYSGTPLEPGREVVLVCRSSNYAFEIEKHDSVTRRTG